MDLSTMRTLVRRDLKDEDAANYRWTDNDIDRCIGRALFELSRYVPLEVKSTLATVADSREINISTLTNRVSVDRVEFPIDEHPRSFQRFAVYQDTITLLGDVEGDGTNCYIYWGQVHTLGVATSSTPAYLEDVLALGAAAYAVLSQAQYRTDTAGFGGSAADKDYQSWGSTLLKDFKFRLKRFGRNRKLKISQFYQGDDNE